MWFWRALWVIVRVRFGAARIGLSCAAFVAVLAWAGIRRRR